MRRRAERESHRLEERRRRLLGEIEREGGVDTLDEDDLRARLALIEEGRGLAVERPRLVRHRLQTLLGVFDAYGVVARQSQPVVSVADLFAQHLDSLQAEADEKGGIAALLQRKFEKTYRVAAPRSLFEAG